MNDTQIAEKLVTEARTAYKKKEYLQSAQLFRSAADGYANLGEDLTAAEMLNNSSVAYLQAGDPKMALETASGTEKTFAAANDNRRRAIATGNQAAALEGLGKLEDAANLYETSAELFKQSGDPELRATVLQSLSSIQLRLGRQLEALASMQTGLDGIEKPSLKQKLVKKILRSPLDILNRSS